MVLYHAISTYHIFKFCVHKLRFHQNEEAILLVPNFLLRKPSGVLKPNVSEIFKKVYFFDWERKSVSSEASVIAAVDCEMKVIINNND